MIIKVFSMGGTIDKVYFDDLSEYEVGDPQAGVIFAEAKVAFEFAVEEVLRKDSLHLDDADRLLLRSRVAADPAQLILVTHGTDSMVATGQALLGLGNKVIVLTGALSPARFKGSDAPFNLGCAVGALQVLPAGVYIAMNGRVFDVEHVRKNRTAGRFEDV